MWNLKPRTLISLGNVPCQIKALSHFEMSTTINMRGPKEEQRQ